MRGIAVPPGYLGALVLEGPIEEVRMFDWSPGAIDP
jgi:hypothetical protein